MVQGRRKGKSEWEEAGPTGAEFTTPHVKFPLRSGKEHGQARASGTEI